MPAQAYLIKGNRNEGNIHAQRRQYVRGSIEHTRPPLEPDLYIEGECFPSDILCVFGCEFPFSDALGCPNAFYAYTFSGGEVSGRAGYFASMYDEEGRHLYDGPVMPTKLRARNACRREWLASIA